MTKPNELTLEMAVERVEKGLAFIADQLATWSRIAPEASETTKTREYHDALRLVIEAAKEAVTVNPDTPRAKHLRRLRELRKSHAKWATWPRPEQLQQQSAGCAESLQWALTELERPMALSGEERKSLEEMQAQGDAALARALAAEDNDEAGREWSRKFHARYDTALTAALSLASSFTEEDLRFFRAGVGRDINELENNPRAYPSAHIGGTPALKVLLAKLDAMLAQPEQNQ